MTNGKGGHASLAEVEVLVDNVQEDRSFDLKDDGSISRYSKEPFKEDTKLEVFMNGKKVSTLGTFKKGTLLNDFVYGSRFTTITSEQARNPENKFEIKANGITIVTFDRS
ncbi:hypothetical protein [Bacillus thuringiensis]|uniref:Uncharacterized protein n=1 Tax=Bacillus thuringiensis serovar andalousiensis TaxID=257985 RepID=A0A6H0TMN7_BACTU|nr:hypothetical protein [Bacillus thuringiensis]QIW22421.1 hypothetical protein EVG22_30965 [Bacillus thuringiensis serovar andalousiensis]